jgi:hypothetical protein
MIIIAGIFESYLHLISILPGGVEKIHLSASSSVLPHPAVAKIGCSFAFCLQKFFRINDIASE